MVSIRMNKQSYTFCDMFLTQGNLYTPINVAMRQNWAQTCCSSKEKGPLGRN